MLTGCGPEAETEREPPGARDQRLSDCDCRANLYDCPDFGPRPPAQACYERCCELGAGDVHRLDRDGDGLACE